MDKERGITRRRNNGARTGGIMGLTNGNKAAIGKFLTMSLCEFSRLVVCYQLITIVIKSHHTIPSIGPFAPEYRKMYPKEHIPKNWPRPLHSTYPCEHSFPKPIRIVSESYKKQEDTLS